MTKNNKTYTLSLEELVDLCRDYLVDCHDGFVSNDRVYVERWLTKKKKNKPSPQAPSSVSYYGVKCERCGCEFSSTDPNWKICPSCYE